MTFGTLMFDWPIPLSDHIRIASGVLHRLPPGFSLMLSSPSVYHILSHVIFALTVFFRRLGVIGRHGPAFAHPQRVAGAHPGARALVTVARLMQHLANRFRGDLG